MSAIDNQNAAAASAEDLKLQQEQLKTQQSLVDAVKSYLFTIAERCATIQSVIESKKDNANKSDTKNDESAKNDAISKLVGNVGEMVKGVGIGVTGFMKVLNPKNLFKDNKKDTLLKKSFFKLVGKNLTKLVKQNEKEVAAAPAGGNGGVPSAPGGQGQPGGNNQNNNAISAKDAVNMGKQIGGMLAESLNPVKLITTFIKVLLPKILVGILLLTIFIEAFFDTDVRTALNMAINIVIVAFLLYIAWQIAKVAFKIGFEILCQSIVTTAELGKVAIELAESMMVYAAFLFIIPLILICFVIMTVAIIIVITAILNIILEIVKTVCDTIVKVMDLFFKYLFGLAGDTSEKNEARKEEQAAKYDPNDAKDLVAVFIDTATTAIAQILNMTDMVGASALAALGTVIFTMVKFMTVAMLWLVNPIYMMAAAIVAGIASLTGNKNTDNEKTEFSKALEPLLTVVTSIKTILEKYAGNIKSATTNNFTTISKSLYNKYAGDDNLYQGAMPTDHSDETIYVTPSKTDNGNTSSLESDDASLPYVLSRMTDTINKLNQILEKSTRPKL